MNNPHTAENLGIFGEQLSQNPLPTEADRLRLMNMFKAIAEYGRKVRQRRAAEDVKQEQAEQVEPYHAFSDLES